MEQTPKKINLRASNDMPLSITEAQIPTLSPQDKLNYWMEGDETPYYKIQEIEYPIMANGYRYTESFFESFIEKINRAPIPGSKDGHDMRWGSRPTTDLLLVGGIVKSNGDGTGKVYLKNYIPQFAESDNKNFIKEAKAGMIDFSLVSYTRDQKVENADGSEVWEVVESMFGERNDAVGYAEGAMKQKTNKADVPEEHNEQRGEGMDVKATLEALTNHKANGALSLHGIAKHLGLEDKLITDDQKEKLNTLAKANSLIGDNTDIVSYIKEVQKERKENAAAVREARMTTEFGAETIKETGKKNKAREMAKTLIGDRELTDEVIAEVKKNELYLEFQGQVADPDSEMNEFGKSHKQNAGNIGGAVEV